MLPKSKPFLESLVKEILIKIIYIYPEQAWESYLLEIKPNPVTAFAGAGLSQPPLLERAELVTYTGAEPATSMEQGPSYWTSAVPGTVRNLCGSKPKQVTSLGTGLNDLQDCKVTTGSTKRPPGSLSTLQDYWGTSGMTGNIALTPPLGETIWAFDPLALGRVITRDIILALPIREIDG